LGVHPREENVIRPDLIAAKPEDVGIDSERLEGVFRRAAREVEQFSPNSAQLAVARNGKVAGIRTLGVARQGGVERAATNETLYCMFSCTKAVVAAAVWLLFEEDLLRLEERVADVIPEFGTNGKDAVTVEQTLLHIGGFPRAPLGPKRWLDRDERLKAFSEWRLTFDPGSRYEYHATSAHWVLAELMERRTGVEFRQFVRERVARPMGLEELFLGLPPEYDARVADVRYVLEPAEPPDGWGEVTPEFIVRFNTDVARRAGVPGAGAYSGAGEIALFYQTLINGGETVDGARVMKPETIESSSRPCPRHSGEPRAERCRCRGRR
jgi:CubicO group peptidase (beta-lactamase class C family)